MATEEDEEAMVREEGRGRRRRKRRRRRRRTTRGRRWREGEDDQDEGDGEDQGGGRPPWRACVARARDLELLALARGGAWKRGGRGGRVRGEDLIWRSWLSAASGPGSFDVERSGDLKAADRSRLNGRRSVGNHRRAARPATVPGLWAIGIMDIL